MCQLCAIARRVSRPMQPPRIYDLSQFSITLQPQSFQGRELISKPVETEKIDMVVD